MESYKSTFENAQNSTDLSPFLNGSTVLDQGGGPQEPLLYVATVGIELVSGLITNMLSLLYIKLKLNINEHIARILTLDSLNKLVLLSLTLVAFVLIHIGGIRNLYTCSLFTLAGFISYSASFMFPAATAVVR